MVKDESVHALQRGWNGPDPGDDDLVTFTEGISESLSQSLFGTGAGAKNGVDQGETSCLWDQKQKCTRLGGDLSREQMENQRSVS